LEVANIFATIFGETTMKATFTNSKLEDSGKLADEPDGDFQNLLEKLKISPRIKDNVEIQDMEDFSKNSAQKFLAKIITRLSDYEELEGESLKTKESLDAKKIFLELENLDMPENIDLNFELVKVKNKINESFDEIESLNKLSQVAELFNGISEKLSSFRENVDLDTVENAVEKILEKWSEASTKEKIEKDEIISSIKVLSVISNFLENKIEKPLVEVKESAEKNSKIEAELHTQATERQRVKA